MALHWDITKIAHIPSAEDGRATWYEFLNDEGTAYDVWKDGKLTGERQLYTNWEILETVIWRCMAVGIGTLTRKNVETFILRSEVWEALNGGVKLSRLSIYRHIGLHTNVTTETDAAWWRSLRETVTRNLSYDIRQTVNRWEK